MKRVKEFERVEDSLASLLEDIKKKGVKITLSPIFKTPEEVERGSPLFLDMVEDALILHDRDDFFARRMVRLRERLIALGAKRIWRGNAWYWDLKPDKLRIAGCYLKRQGGSYSLWTNPKTGVVEAIPLHNEIKEPLAKKILKALDEGWTPDEVPILGENLSCRG